MCNLRQLWVAFFVLILAACGGGGTLGESGSSAQPTYEISVTTTANGTASTELRQSSPLRLSVTLKSSKSSVSGQLVAFTLNDNELAKFSNQAGTAISNANGVAQIDLLVGSKSGAGVVTVALGNGERTTVSFNSAGDAPAADVVSLTLALRDAQGNVTTQLSKNSPLTLTATLRSSLNQSQAGKLIKFNVDNLGLATFSNQATTAATDANGVATIGLLVGNVSGSGKITAQLDGNATVKQDLVFTSAGDGAAVNVKPIGSVVLYADKLTLSSGNSDKIELTALVRDEQNNFMRDVKVEFAGNADAEIEVVNAVTGSNGVAKATLTTKANPTLRQIQLTASATVGTTKRAQLLVDVVGTAIEVTAPQAVVIGKSAELSFNVIDASGNGLNSTVLKLNSALGNTFSVTEPVTNNASGRATVLYTASTSGRDTVTVSALGVVQTFQINVDTDQFGFVGAKATPIEVPLNTAHPMTVQWLSNNSPMVARAVNFATTRGTISPDQAGLTLNRSAVSQNTDAQGNATVLVQSQFAGFTNVSATSSGSAGAIAATQQVEFVATTPTVSKGIEVQAFPTKVGPGEKSVVTAILRDANNNPIKNLDVSFSLDSAAGGVLNPAVAKTNSLGIATTEFTADATTAGSGTPASETGLQLKAQLVTDAQIKGSTPIIVGKRTLFFRFGTGNEIEKVGSTLYKKQFAIVVTDSAGNPVPNQRLNVQVYPKAYRKGTWVKNPGVGAFINWKPIYSTAENTINSNTCLSEDVNRNGILDAGEDRNNDKELTPGNIASVFGTESDPSVAVSDAEGIALFNLQYPREFAPWLVVDLVVSSGNVAGTENVTSRSYTLTVAGVDTNNEALPPPANPFGIALTNATIELVNGEFRFVERDQRCN